MCNVSLLLICLAFVVDVRYANSSVLEFARSGSEPMVVGYSHPILDKSFAGSFNPLKALFSLLLAVDPFIMSGFNPSSKIAMCTHFSTVQCPVRHICFRRYAFPAMSTSSHTDSGPDSEDILATARDVDVLSIPRLRETLARRQLLQLGLASVLLPSTTGISSASAAADSRLPMLITGAGSGIGNAAARLLAAQGQTVICACRSAEAAKATAAEIGAQATALDVGLEQSDLGSVRTYTERLAQQYPDGIGSVLLCAGIEGVPLQRTAQGLETHYGVNVVSHFALAAELAAFRKGKQSKSPPLRVVSVTSSAAFDSDLSPGADLNWQSRTYSPRLAYVNSKACNVLLADELQRRAGGTFTACSVDPGPTATQIVRYTLPQRAEQRKTMTPEQIAKQARKLSLRTPAQAAEGLVWCLQSDECEPGGLYLGIAAKPGTPPPLPVARDPVPWRSANVAEAVWRDCTARTKDFLSPAAQAFVA